MSLGCAIKPVCGPIGHKELNPTGQVSPELNCHNEPNPPPGPGLPIQHEPDHIPLQAHIHLLHPPSVQRHHRRRHHVVQRHRAVLLRLKLPRPQVRDLHPVEPHLDAQVRERGMGSGVVILGHYGQRYDGAQEARLVVVQPVEVGVCHDQVRHLGLVDDVGEEDEEARQDDCHGEDRAEDGEGPDERVRAVFPTEDGPGHTARGWV